MTGVIDAETPVRAMARGAVLIWAIYEAGGASARQLSRPLFCPERLLVEMLRYLERTGVVERASDPNSHGGVARIDAEEIFRLTKFGINILIHRDF